MSKKTGILLVNLGSPDSPSVSDVRRYLRQFLMDGFVLDVPVPLRWLIVNLAILPTRPKQSAHAYQSVWTDEGSPLVVMSRRYRDAIADKLAGTPVELGMRYGNPSIASSVQALSDLGVTHFVLVPLYPHYAMSTVTTVQAEFKRVQPAGTTCRVVNPFYADDRYIQALASSMAAAVSEADHVLFSYHGVPERHLRKTDPTMTHCLNQADCCACASPAHATCYRHQVFETTRRVSAALGLPKDRYTVAFQSRLGRDPWLTPFADDTIVALAGAGIKKLAVVCPAFVADCLETIEEIGMSGKAAFLAAGGESFTLIDCLNVHPQWIDASVSIIQDYCN